MVQIKPAMFVDVYVVGVVEVLASDEERTQWVSHVISLMFLVIR